MDRHIETDVWIEGKYRPSPYCLVRKVGILMQMRSSRVPRPFLCQGVHTEDCPEKDEHSSSYPYATNEEADASRV